MTHDLCLPEHDNLLHLSLIDMIDQRDELVKLAGLIGGKVFAS